MVARTKKQKSIDTTVWITQQALAAELNVSVQCINNWIRRKKIEYLPIPGSRLVLVNKETAPAVGIQFKKKQ